MRRDAAPAPQRGILFRYSVNDDDGVILGEGVNRTKRFVGVVIVDVERVRGQRRAYPLLRTKNVAGGVS